MQFNVKGVNLVFMLELLGCRFVKTVLLVHFKTRLGKVYVYHALPVDFQETPTRKCAPRVPRELTATQMAHRRALRVRWGRIVPIMDCWFVYHAQLGTLPISLVKPNVPHACQDPTLISRVHKIV